MKKKLIAVFLSALLICLAAAGCGQSSETPADNGVPAGDSAAPAPDADAAKPPAQASGFVTAYPAYMEIKSDLVSRLAEGMTDSRPAAAMELLGMNMIEMYLVPIAALGADEDYARTVLSYVNAGDIKYTADENHYMVTYSDAEGSSMTCETTYDPAKDAAYTKIIQGDEEALIFEYLKTSYGYASQYYLKNDDGTYSVYMGTFYNGKDGVIGVSDHAAVQPESLLGKSEPAKDSPKSCGNWYEAKGTAGTGKSSDGETFEFSVPAEASN